MFRSTCVSAIFTLLLAPGGMRADVIPRERLADWTPGVMVGVPGGIPADRMRLIDVTKPPYNADNTGASDAQPAIQKAVADAKEKEVVYLPAGKYRIDHSIAVGCKSRITIRGDGPEKTIILGRQPSGGAIQIGSGGADWWYLDRLELDITGSPKRGATVLTVKDTKVLDAFPYQGGIGQPCQVSLMNDRTLPVVATAHFEYMRKQVSRIVAKTATTVTISPGLLFDLPDALAPRLRPAGLHAELVGVEDLAIDGTNSKAPHGLVSISSAYACWVKNVSVQSAERYLFDISDSLQCEIRHSTIAKRKSAAGPNGGGLLFGTSSFCLVEDNIIAETFPHMEINGSSGNVFAYNFCDDRGVQGGLLGCSINSNHNAHCTFNLYEGNLAPKFQCDGYHGSASHDTAFRNWFHGTSTQTDQFWICVNLNRFTRDYSIVGNVLGRKGHTWLHEVEPVGFSYGKHFLYSLGYPNLGNGWSNGKTAQLSKGRPWADWDNLLASPRGKGPGPGGFQELDLDVKATTLLKGNYNYKDNGVPESESIGGTSLPKSLYLKDKPVWFGDLPWPPFGPDVDCERNRIPAQERFEGSEKGEKEGPKQ